MSRVDKALAALDAGLQSSTETGYGTDHRPDRCARCQRNRPGPGDADLCFLCRDFLLGDSDRDPAALPAAAGLRVADDGTVEGYIVVFGEENRDAIEQVLLGIRPSPGDVERLAAAFTAFLDHLVEVFEPVLEHVAGAVAELSRQVYETIQQVAAHIVEALPDRSTPRCREAALLERRRRSHRRTNRWGRPPGRR